MPLVPLKISALPIELKAFDYFDSALFFPEYSNEEKLMAYGILGGIPCYLQAFDSEKPIEKNIAREILREGRFLKDEPIYFLKQELREPAIYNSIFEAIAGGASRVNEIATKIHEDTQKCSKYLGILQTIRLIKKAVPCGEDEASRKTIYKIADNYFSFWYHFLFEKKSFYEILGPEESAKEIMDPQSFFSYFGFVFETIHPFLDGNGRMGRLLITLFLVSKGILDKPLLYLSAFFEKNRSLYYDKLTITREKNDLNQWIKFFLVGIIETAEEGSATLEKIMQIKAKAENKILSFGRRAESAHKLLEALFSKPMVSIKGVQTITNLSPKAAGELVSLFVDNELLHEVSNQQRNRAFAFTEYLDLFMK